MSVKGSLKANLLTLGSLSIDWMKPQGVQVKVVGALIDTDTGRTRAWVDGTGVVWSEKTGRALNALRVAMEEDIAAEHLSGSYRAEEENQPAPEPGGLGEYLGSLNDVPSV